MTGTVSVLSAVVVCQFSRVRNELVLVHFRHVRSSGVGGIQTHAPPPTYGHLEPLARDIEELTGMGFSQQDAVIALRLKVSQLGSFSCVYVCACVYGAEM